MLKRRLHAGLSLLRMLQAEPERKEGRRDGQWEEVGTKGESGLGRGKKERVCLLRKSLKASVCVRVTESLRGHDSSLSRAREEVG